jgi:hypothetical protein
MRGLRWLSLFTLCDWFAVAIQNTTLGHSQIIHSLHTNPAGYD